MYHLAKSLYLYATSKEEYSVLLLGLDNAGKTTLLSAIRSLYHPSNASTTSSSSSSSKSAPPIASKTVPTVGQNVGTIALPDLALKFWDVGGQHALRRLWQSYYRSCHAIIFVVDSTDVGAGADLYPNTPLTAGLPSAFSPRSTAPRVSFDARTLFARTGDDNNHRSERETAGTAPGNAPGSASGPGTSSSAAGSNSNTMHISTTAGNPSTNVNVNAGAGGRLAECRLVLESVLASVDTVGVPILVLANKQDREDCVETVRIKEGLVRPVFEGERGAGLRDSRVLPISALTGAGVREAVEWVRSRVKWNREGRPPVMKAV